MKNSKTTKYGITHKFIHRPDVFTRMTTYSATQIITKVQANGWFFAGYDYRQNVRMVRSAIRQGVVMHRILRVGPGQYRFL